MGLKTTSSSNFLNNVSGQAAPKPAADDAPVQEGGPAVEDHQTRKGALRQTPQPSPFINAVPKFSTGPRSRQATFPTKSENERQAP